MINETAKTEKLTSVEEHAASIVDDCYSEIHDNLKWYIDFLEICYDRIKIVPESTMSIESTEIHITVWSNDLIQYAKLKFKISDLDREVLKQYFLEDLKAYIVQIHKYNKRIAAHDNN